MRKNLVCGDKILTKDEIAEAALEQIEEMNICDNPKNLYLFDFLKRFPHKIEKFQCSKCRNGFQFSCRDREWMIPNIWKGEKRTQYVVRSSSTDVCPICIEPLQKRKTIKTGCCGHEFHEKCFEKMFYFMDQRFIGTPCPYCRTHINKTFDTHLWRALRHKDYIPGKLKNP